MTDADSADGPTVVPSEFFDALLEDTPPVPNEATRQAQRRLPHIIASSDGHVEYAWGESVTWTHPGRITVPLNRDGRYVADLVLGAKETSVLVDMLTDAANPESRKAYDRRRTVWTGQDAYDRSRATDGPPEDESRVAAWYAAKYLKCASCGTPESVKPTVFRLPNGGGDLCAECAKPVIDSTRAIEEAIARRNEKAPAIREPEAGEQ